MEYDEQAVDVAFYPRTYSVASGTITITWNPPPDNGITPSGAREPRKPAPGSPGMPAYAEPSYTGG